MGFNSGFKGLTYADVRKKKRKRLHLHGLVGYRRIIEILVTVV